MASMQAAFIISGNEGINCLEQSLYFLTSELLIEESLTCGLNKFCPCVKTSFS